MEKTEFGPSTQFSLAGSARKSPRRSETQTSLFHSWFRMLLLPALLLPLADCSTLSGLTSLSTSSTAAKAVVCWPKPITYSSSKDTPQTVRQVRVYNKTGKNLKCPGF